MLPTGHPPAVNSATDPIELLLDPPTAQQKRRPGYFWPFAVALVVIGLDQWTKRLVEESLSPLGSGKSFEWLGGQIRIIYIVNKGASFGFLNNADIAWVFSLLALAASVGIIGWYLWRGTQDRWLQLGMGLVLGGIIGNLLDRLLQNGGVTDIITIPNIGLFKVFNLADSGITSGVALIIARMVIGGWWRERQSRRSRPAVPPDQEL